MRISGVLRVALLAAAAVSTLSLPSTTEANLLVINSERNVAAFDATMIDPMHATRVLATAPLDEDEEAAPVPKKKKKEKKEKKESTHGPTEPSQTKKSKKATKKKTAEESKEDKEIAEEEELAEVLEEVIKEAEEEEHAKEAEEEEHASNGSKKEKKKADKVDQKGSDASESTKKPTKDPKKTAESEDASKQSADNTVKEKKIKGNKNEGTLDGSSEGSSEIDKIDARNNDGWESVYDDPPLLVIKASLYAFIAYNDSEVCDTFNMTMNAVEQKAEENGHFSYHVVAYINCTKNNEDETQGRFILNFIPEGKRLLLTECGHREEGEIVNWLRIDDEVPECMTPKQRKQFLTQPMKHIHISNGTNSDVEAVQTDFLSRLEEFDTEEVAIFGSATVALIAVVVVLVVFVIRKRKVQKDLERTIAGAKAEHAVEDDDMQTEVEEKAIKERKGLMDSAKTKSDDPDMEEGSFVNSPAVRV